MNTPESKKLFHKRLLFVAGEYSLKELGKITETPPETVRRYMNGAVPSTAFVTKLCSGLGVSGAWLLLGTKPMMTEDLAHYTLKKAKPEQLMSALTELLIDMSERLERLERLEELNHTEEATISIPKNGISIAS